MPEQSNYEKALARVNIFPHEGSEHDDRIANTFALLAIADELRRMNGYEEASTRMGRLARAAMDEKNR